MINKKITTIITIFFLIMLFTNVFAYTSKNRLTADQKSYAESNNINFIEFKSNDGVKITAKPEGGCEVYVSFNQSYLDLQVNSQNNIKFVPHIMVSTPLANKNIYLTGMSNFLIREISNRARTQTPDNYRYYYKPDYFTVSEYTFNVPNNFCNSSKNTMDVIVFIPVDKDESFLYTDNQNYNNVYVKAYSPIGRSLGHHSVQYDLSRDKTDIFTLINLRSNTLYNFDFAYGVPVDKSKLNETPTPPRTTPITQTGNDYLPAGTIIPRVDRRSAPENANQYNNSALVIDKQVILGSTVSIIEKNPRNAQAQNNVQRPNLNEVAEPDATYVANTGNLQGDDFACKLKINLQKELRDYPVISPTEMHFLVSWSTNLRNTYPTKMHGLVSNNTRPSGNIISFKSTDYEKIYETRGNSRIIVGYKLRIPRSAETLCTPRTIDVYAFMPIEKSNHQVVTYSTRTKVFTYHLYSNNSRNLEELKETELNTNHGFLYLKTAKPLTSTIEYYNYNLDYLYDIRTTDSDTPASVNIDTINGGTCPGRCPDQGYHSSENYPIDFRVGDTIYNGSGAICYKCNDQSTVATRCDPRDGRLLGNLDLVNTASGQIIRQQICPIIDIDIPFPEIGNFPLEPIDLYDHEMSEFGEIYDIGPGYFDCNITEKSTIQERLNLTYSNNNALYYVNGGTRNDVMFDASTSDINITLNKNRFTSKYYFTQVKDYASACFIENINIPELLENNKRFINPDSAEIINGNVIAKLRILPDGKRLEVCINRPINVLSDSEKIISNMPFMSNNVKKIFTIKQKRTFWFSKKIKDISFVLNVELAPFGCDVVSTEETQLNTTTDFFGLSLQEESCYNPQGTASTGLTGKSNYEKYGFDKLLFIYDTEGIKHNYCDFGEKYCDQDQLKVALLKKAELIKDQKTITLDGIIFAKSEDNKIEKNTNIYLTDEINKINADNLISSDFTYSENPEEYLNTLIIQLNKIPEELRKFVILDLTFTGPFDPLINGNCASEDEVILRVNKISGNKYHNYLRQTASEISSKSYYTGETKNIYSYQITVDSFLKNQQELRNYFINESTEVVKVKNIVFLRQLIQNLRIYYGDSVSPVLVNAKTYGSLDGGLTRDIFTSVQFLNESNKPITLLSDSEVKVINAPGLYLYELVLTGDTINYKVKNTTQETKNFFDYYNLDRYQEYKQNLLFTNPINAIYKNYSGIPFKYNDSDVGLTQGNATVYSDYTNWNEIQNGYILEVRSNNSGIENISFKNIRPLYIQASSNYSYNYLKPNGRYSDNVNKTVGKETVFVFLDYTANNPQFVIESTNDLILNIPIAPQIINNTKKYNVLNDLRTPNQTVVDFDDLYSGIETANVGYMLTLIKHNQICFNFENNKINFWLNPEKMIKN